jgi:hypothetical protein
MLPASSRLTTILSSIAYFASLLACASTPTPTTRAPEATSPPTASSDAPPASSAATPADSAPSAASQRPLDLTNNCPHDMHIYYGEQPGDGKGQASTITAGGVVPVPRTADGSVVVWVTDEKGGGLADVHVTKRMRHVRIDATCMKIDADSTR